MNRFPGYHIDDKLQSASFIQRFLAHSEEPEAAQVVITCLSDQLKSMRELQLYFQDCARRQAHLKLDGLLPIREMGSSADNGFYIVQNWLEAIDLEDIRRLQLTSTLLMEPAVSGSIIAAMVRILEKCHAKGLIHTSLQPHHVYIDRNGELYITGFIEAEMRRRFDLPVNHDPKWDCPEQRRGTELTAASDIYAIGMLFYRMLIRKAQPDEWEPQWMGLMMELSTEGIPGEALNRATEFFQHTLAERPQQRFASLEVLSHELAHLNSELGGEKPREVIADVLQPYFPVPTVKAWTHTIELISDDQPCVEVPEENAEQPVLAPSKETRVISRNGGDYRTLSPRLRQNIGISPLEILSRSRYQILEEIGSGGTGTVYKVLDTTLSEILALKVLRPELVNDAAWLQRFKRELKITRDLEHRNILPAYHLEQLEGLYFFTMRYVDGETLFDILHSRILSVSKALDILIGVGQALIAAHSHGIVHRDFKSANIMVERETEHPYLMDFGIALTPDNPGLTMAGQGIGTPSYMAPEQSRGEHIGPLADIYSFGIVCYEALTGRLPFTGPTTVAIYTAQISGIYAPLTDYNPEIPKPLVQLIGHCLQPIAENRPPSMEIVIQKILDIRQEFGI